MKFQLVSSLHHTGWYMQHISASVWRTSDWRTGPAEHVTLIVHIYLNWRIVPHLITEAYKLQRRIGNDRLFVIRMGGEICETWRATRGTSRNVYRYERSSLCRMSTSIVLFGKCLPAAISAQEFLYSGEETNGVN